ILRAIRAAFLNEGHDDDIRHGSVRSEVTLSFNEGTVIVWYKEMGKGGCYAVRIVGQPEQSFTKTNGVVPDQIKEYLGIGEIEVDANTKLTPQLSDQFDEPFILWETGSKRARIIGKATRLDMVVTAQLNCKKTLDKSKRDVGTREEQLVSFEEKLQSIPDYKALEKRLSTADEMLDLVRDNSDIVSHARELGEELEVAQSLLMTVDTARVRSSITEATEMLTRAEHITALVKQLREATAELNVQETHAEDVRIAAESLREQYQSGCEEQGVCTVCDGLLNHEECAG
ncbi:hypothetical protein LCGC14_2552300, partial [marine sediment metagenome]